QTWIDQAISRNIYLASRDVDEMVDLYSAAWRKGIKTTDYLHMMPRHRAEQSTVKVNKAEQVRTESGSGGSGGRRGFGFARSTGTPPARSASPTLSAPQMITVSDDADTCPTDPQERLQCDSCQ